MNISELARRLRTNAEELKEKLPGLGFDIGKKAIKIDDNIAYKIMKVWKEYQQRQLQEKEYLQRKQIIEEAVAEKGEIRIPPVLTVKDFASLLGLPVTDIIKELMKAGVMASLNQRIDYDTAAIIAEDLGFISVEGQAGEAGEIQQDEKVKQMMEDETDRQARPPVIVVMGHVDHGKTKLLDAIRQTDVVSGESGGITQHIGAYQIHKKGRLITFIDTPGHEAFTAMRSRGAKVADITILVVAANDSVKPQTIEAIKIAENAGTPVIVAINKIDLPDANIEKTKQDLSQHRLMTEEWGGNTICVPISAKKNQNIDELIDQVLLVADMEADKIVASPKGTVLGTVVESHIDKGQGPVSTVLIQNGTLRAGDQVVVNGNYYGKIKVMHDYLGKVIKEAGPSTPAQIIGLKVAPKVGDLLEITNEKVKKVKSYKLESKDESFISHSDDSADDESITRLNIILRSDVLGSQEAVAESLEKLNTDKIKIKFFSKGLGSINESDVMSADATGALLLGFNVLPSPQAKSLARDKEVVIKQFKIIYELIDEVKARINEIIKPEIVREDLGKVQVLQIFKKLEHSMIIGGKVLSGKIEPNSEMVVLRDDNFLVKGRLMEMQVGKQSVTDAVKGQEFGMTYKGQPLIEEGDILDIYKEREVKHSI